MMNLLPRQYRILNAFVNTLEHDAFATLCRMVITFRQEMYARRNQEDAFAVVLNKHDVTFAVPPELRCERQADMFIN